MDYTVYKNRMFDYLRARNIQFNTRTNTSCILGTHKDSNPSMKITDTNAVCFSCGFNGDIYDVAGFFESITDKGDQYRHVQSVLGGESVSEIKVPEYKEKEISKEASEVLNLYLSEITKQNKRKVLEFAKYRGYGEDFAEYLMYWPGFVRAKADLGYETLKKCLINENRFMSDGVMCRFNNGWKLFYVENGKTVKMGSTKSKPFPFPDVPDNETVVIVEGEICAISCRTIGIPAVSIGGVNNFSVMNAKMLKDKKIIICFDADDAGVKAVEGAVKNAKIAGCQYINVANLDPSIGKDPDDYIKNGHADKLKSILDVEFVSVKEEAKESLQESKELVILGCDSSNHYFMDRADGILHHPRGKLNSGFLLEIADLEFWETIKLNQQGNPDWQFISNMVISLSTKKQYDQKHIRGIGVWEDNGNIIVSDGTEITVGKERINIRDFKSDYIYVKRQNKGIGCEYNKMWNEDLKFLNKMFNTITLKTPQDGKLLFGWIISSIFLAVLDWRPVVYMKGSSQVGKSWTMNNVVREILGKLCINPNKSSTVKGVMQAPGCDARMVTIDELEDSSERSAHAVITGLMTLARDSTTKSKEARYTGTQDQSGQSTNFLSMFLFASIVESSEEDQDVNRITAVNFAKKENKNWADDEAEILSYIDEGLGNRIVNNAIYHRDSIVKNVKTFRRAAAKKADRQRAADNMGTLIAGWYHIEHPGKYATIDEAESFMEEFDFTDQNDRGKGKMMEVIMSPILSYKVRYDEEQEVKSNFQVETGDSEIRVVKRERTVYSVLKELNDVMLSGEPTTRHVLNKVLMDYGVRYGTAKHRDHLIIALNHEGVKKMMPQTFAYKSNYFDYFKEHKDYVGKERTVKFNGVVFQAMAFKVDFDDEELLY